MTTRKISSLALLAAMAAALISSGPAAASEAHATFEIRGYVPLICRATFSGSVVSVSDGVYPLGTVDEFCNSGSGYAVAVEYDGSDEAGQLLVDGRPVALDRSGHTEIDRSAGPASLLRQISYAPGAQPITTLRVYVNANSF